MTSNELSVAEQLALGIGNPQSLSLTELEDFFKIIYPIESDFAFSKNKTKLLKEAEQYLKDATPLNYWKNALQISNSKKKVDDRIMEFIRNTTLAYAQKST